MKKQMFKRMGFPEKKGLYDPSFEKDACGFGFIADINNEPKHEIVHQALDIVHKLDHRGAIGADPLAGDGAGILIQLPDKFFRNYFKNHKISLPDLGDYAVGMVFLPNDKTRSSIAQKAIEQSISDEGQIFIGWRDVPTDDSVLGHSVKNNKPIIKQFFIQRSSNCIDENHFQRKLYVIRKTVHKKYIRVIY